MLQWQESCSQYVYNLFRKKNVYLTIMQSRQYAIYGIKNTDKVRESDE